VEQHPAPAGDLFLQLDLQGVLLAEDEALEIGFPKLRARRPAE
jgi:hypothetical protein